MELNAGGFKYTISTVVSVKKTLQHVEKGNLKASVAEWLREWDTLTMLEATVCGRS